MDEVKNKIKVVFPIIIWVVALLVFSNGNFIGEILEDTDTVKIVTEDVDMVTNRYNVDMTINDDNSYTLKEDIDVTFDTYKHGIYRYIPEKGFIFEKGKNEKIKTTPFYASMDNVDVLDDNYDVSKDNGNHLIKIGDSDETITGDKEYNIEYKITPYTDKGYKNVYYNVYSTGWQNETPAGSKFTIHFPKKFDPKNIAFYYGSFGESKDGKDILDYEIKDTTISGVLKESLGVGEGLTIYVPMKEGYFVGAHKTSDLTNIVLYIIIAIGLISIVLFIKYGRDEKIIRSIQFVPPKGLDSAAVGYIIDGEVSNEDVISLIIYWANKGYIKIKNDKDMVYTKIKDIPNDAPKYQKDLFNKIFSKDNANIGSQVKVSSLKYKLASTFEKVKKDIKNEHKGIYTSSSINALFVVLILTIICPFVFTFLLYKLTGSFILSIIVSIVYFVGVGFLYTFVSKWYSLSKHNRIINATVGIILMSVPLCVYNAFIKSQVNNSQILNIYLLSLVYTIVLIINGIIIAFIKKRTHQSVETMGYLVGLREFIETAELDRMQVMANDSPQLFYHILPYAYVFGISDILLDKMKNLTLESPDWAEGSRNNNSRYTWYDYYFMHTLMHTGMSTAVRTISTPKPSPSSSENKGLFGGGFSGGGFSGGGFGGGGGGSW